MWLMVGLGNPGPKYENNRHNIGFMAVDAIVRRHSFSPFRKKHNGVISEGTLNGEKVLVLKPLTFMNESGRAVGSATRFHKIKAAQVIVFHDELDLAFGKLRVKQGGGHGGHNGLRSTQSHIGPDFHRVRLGIGHPGDKNMVTPYVLSDFAKGEREYVDAWMNTIAGHAGFLIEDNGAEFMNRVSLDMHPPRPKSSRPPASNEGK